MIDPGYRHRSLNVLIVDFSPMMRAMLKRVTQLSGVPITEFFEAENGKQALEILETVEIDVMFTTISMPEMSGMELLHHMHERPEWDGILRVAVSSDASPEWRLELRRLKVRGVVEKPFRPEAVRD